jgi:hypothetical protein
LPPFSHFRQTQSEKKRAKISQSTGATQGHRILQSGTANMGRLWAYRRPNPTVQGNQTPQHCTVPFGDISRLSYSARPTHARTLIVLSVQGTCLQRPRRPTEKLLTSIWHCQRCHLHPTHPNHSSLFNHTLSVGPCLSSALCPLHPLPSAFLHHP